MRKKYNSVALTIVTISSNNIIATSTSLAGGPDGLGINNEGTSDLTGAFGNDID